MPPDTAVQFELVGQELIDGEGVYHLRATISGPELAELMEDQGLDGAGGEVAYWIGVDDYLVRKIEVSAEQQSEGFVMNVPVDTLTTHIVIVFSNYNGDVNIVAPEVESSLWGQPDGTTGTYESPIMLTIGEAVEGAIDVQFQDIVYEFAAEDTAGYLIEVSVGTLPFVDVTVFDSEGNDVGWGGVYEDGTKEPIELDVPFPETYYIVVTNSEGETGTYTLTITPLDDEDG